MLKEKRERKRERNYDRSGEARMGRRINDKIPKTNR